MDRSRESGFSLVEVMVAVFVLALSGIAMVQLMQTTTRNTVSVQERSVARLAAENLLNSALIQPGRLESKSGQYEIAGRRYDWRLEVGPTTDPDLLRLDLRLMTAGEATVLAELQTHRRRSGL